MLRLLLLLVFAWSALAAPPVDTARALDGFDEFMTRAMAELHVPGAAVGVIRNNEVVFLKGYGVRDLDSKKPVTERTVFATGSITKSFTAAAIAALVDDGKLEWDRPVREYLPWFRLDNPHATELITLRDMLSHRSGMPRHDWIRFMIPLDRHELVRRMRYLPFNKTFRQEFQYNNLMYVAAGLIAGEVSGKTWEDIVRDRLFGPLGMTASSTSIRDMQKAPDFAQPHVLRDEKAAQVPFYDYQKYGVGPNGAVNSNATDLLRYVQFFLTNGKVQGRQVISERQMRELLRPAMVAGADTYALGWYLRHERGYTIIEHSGAITGFTASVKMAPQDRLGIVVLNNLGSALPGIVAEELTARMLGFPAVDRIERLRAARSRVEPTRKPTEPAAATSTPSHPLDAYAGKYRHAAFGDLPVEHRYGALLLGLPETTVTLRHLHFDTFEADGRLVQFELDERGSVKGLRLRLEAAVPAFTFERTDAISAVP